MPRLDHIEWAIGELESLADRYKDFAANSQQRDRIENCESAAKLARKALYEVREVLSNAKIKSSSAEDDFRPPESCYCSACRMPPCTFCTTPTEENKE